jgi:hypothetical protein
MLSSFLQTGLAEVNFDLGDRRLNKRAANCLSVLLCKDTSLGFPRIFGDSGQLKAFYRMINNKRVTSSALIAGGHAGLSRYFADEQASNAGDEPVKILAYEDTTAAKYHSRRKLDLGYLQNDVEWDNGMLIHSLIACTAQRFPVGLFSQHFIRRAREEYGKKAQRKQRPFADKESYKWVAVLEPLRAWRATLAYPARIVAVMDSEGDVGEVINWCVAHGFDYLIRSRHDRLVPGHPKLYSLVRQADPVARQKRRLYSRPAGRYYEADCEIRATRAQPQGFDQPTNVVHLRECQAGPDREQPTEWVLLTSLPVDEPAQAQIVLDDYAQRWTITEDFHMALKTGCQIEKRQFDSPEGLCNAIALLSLAAIHLLALRYLSDRYPQIPLSQTIIGQDSDVLTLTNRLAEQYLKPRDYDFCTPQTVKWFVLTLARMGGHQGYAQKGRPGWRLLWQGYTEFQTLLKGIRLFYRDT